MFALAALLIPLWYLVLDGVVSAFSLLVIASKQFQSIALLIYWLTMGDLLHGRQAKRLFAPMMGGYTLGTIVGSFASDPIARAIGIDGLLPVAAGAFALSGLLTLPLRNLIPNRLERGAAARSGRGRSSSGANESESLRGERTESSPSFLAAIARELSTVQGGTAADHVRAARRLLAEAFDAVEASVLSPSRTGPVRRTSARGQAVA